MELILFNNQIVIIYSEKIQEFGVASLLNDDGFAVSINRILFGIAAVLYNVKPLIFFIDNNRYEIDPLLAVTLSDQLGMASIEHLENMAVSLFGSQGKWNSSYCQTEYELDKIGLSVTMAEVNSGIDGWFIGTNLKSNTLLRSLKLSTLIERYYSKAGLFVNCGICSLNLLPPDLIDSIRKTSRYYAFFWNKNYAHNNYDYERIANFNEELSVQFNQLIIKSNQIKNYRKFLFRKCQLLLNQSELIFILLQNAIDYYVFILKNMKQNRIYS